MTVLLSKLSRSYLPMSETAYYILLALSEANHGYGIMQYVEELTNGRIHLGAGTLYGSLSRMEKDGLIRVIAEEDRRKVYSMTDSGNELLKLEITRLGQLYRDGIKIQGGYTDGN